MEKLTAIITTIRHGEKDNEGKITSKGLRQAMEKGVGTNHLNGDLILFHSGASRVRDTIRSVAKHIAHDQNVKGDITLDDFHIQDYIAPSLHYLYKDGMKGNLFSRWEEFTDPKDRINNFLNQLYTSEEPDIYPSPRQMAVNVAKIIKTQIEFSTLTSMDYTTNFINGSHEPVVSSFLYYYLNQYSPAKGCGIDTIGGTIRFAEGFDIYVYQNENGISKCIFKFRDFEQIFNFDELIQFINYK